MTKLCIDSEQSGAWYVFGTKCLLIREYDDDLLWLQEYRSHGNEHFNVYMQAQRSLMKQHMQQLLRTSH